MPGPSPVAIEITLPVESEPPLVLRGDLTTPSTSKGAVVFAHGSGSTRRSPRNIQVAAALNRAGLATLLFDLLSPEEEMDPANVFDIPLLARRLRQAAGWLSRRSDAQLGYFGASTGGGAALLAAAEGDPPVRAVVARGGRPDLAPHLDRVEAATLLIVGELDEHVLNLNRRAFGDLRCEKELAVVPGATHLFEEPGALGRVASLASSWFARHLFSK